MNFFQHQDNARKKTTYSVILFILACVATIAAIYFVIMTVLYIGAQETTNQVNNYNSGAQGSSPPGFIPFSWLQLDVLFGVSGLTLTIIFFGSLYKTRQLGGGGPAVARMLGGVEIAPGTRDLHQRKLLNIVEEMALASGTPVPAVFLLEDDSINAFAAGFTPTDAAIGVTRGAIEKLTRDELQGVVAHEFSHIFHGDMRLNIRLMGILHGIMVIGLLGYFVMRIGFSSRGNDRGAAAMIGLGLVGLCVWIIGYIGLFFGNLIKSGISRQREYLADASAVQYTRNPAGIAGALKKIGGFAGGSKVEGRHVQEASHMFFGSVSRMSALTATHPPLDERIRRIDPSFKGEFPPIHEDYEVDDDYDAPVSGLSSGRGRGKQQKKSKQAVVIGAPSTEPGQSQQANAPSRPTPTFEPPASNDSDARGLTAQIGKPTSQHLAYAAQMIASIPPELVQAAREPYGAMSVVFGLLLDKGNPTVRQAQLSQLQSTMDAQALAELNKVVPYTDSLHPALRLPLIDLAIPALRRLSVEQYNLFSSNVQVLIQADQQVDLFEFTLHKMLFRHLRGHLLPTTKQHVQYHTINVLLNEIGSLVAALAYWGHNDPAEAQKAYAAAIGPLHPSGSAPEMPDASQFSLMDFDRALTAVSLAAPVIKERVLAACNVCVAFDGQITINEAEMFRAIADALDCPSPPVLATTFG